MKIYLFRAIKEKSTIIVLNLNKKNFYIYYFKNSTILNASLTLKWRNDLLHIYLLNRLVKWDHQWFNDLPGSDTISDHLNTDYAESDLYDYLESHVHPLR